MWILLSITSALSFCGMAVAFKYLENHQLSSQFNLMAVFWIVGGLSLIGIKICGEKLFVPCSRLEIGLIIAAALCAYVGNLSQLKAFSSAPNPGYAVAIAGTQAILFTVASIFLFDAEYNLIKIAGVILSVLGLSLLAF